MNFGLTATNVLIMMLYAVPGFLLIRTKLIKTDAIAPFSMLLLYACQPFLTLYSFQEVAYSPELLADMGIVFVLSLFLQTFVLLAMYFIFRKKYTGNVGYRVCTAAGAFGNVGFLGVPLLQALLPEYPQAICFSAVFIVTLNLVCWTLGAFILTGDKKYMSVKKIFLNPAILPLAIALPLFFCNVSLAEITPSLYKLITLMAKMTTSLCMIILGMRLATVRPKELFSDGKVFLASAIKLVIMPLVAYLLMLPLPLDPNIKATAFILCCMPTASIVLNFTEIYENGQKIAANTLLSCTILSMATIPLLLLIL